MDRVSTAGNYSAILANLMAAEGRQVDAENRVSSQKNGNDLKGYANQAETLTAMNTVNARLDTYQTTNTPPATTTTVGNTTGTASPYQTAQLSNYSLALALLG